MYKAMYKKTSYFFALILILAILSFSCDKKDPNMEGDEYTGSAAGYGGNITVIVTVTEDGKINAIKVDAPDEAPNVGGAAVSVIATDIIATQSLSVDAVSGATITSSAILTATENALIDAGLDTNLLKDK